METTDGPRVEKYQALRETLLARLARMVRRCGVRAIFAIFWGATLRLCAFEREGVLPATTRSPLVATEPLLLNPLSFACPFGR
jgi:hypothetical protein